MPQTIRKGFREMVAEAEAAIETLNVEEALARHAGEDTVFVDLRDIRELEGEGVIPGAFHCPLGMLEFWIDPESPYHKPVFAEDKAFLFFCGGGWRSALAARTAADMGLAPVAHIAGGFTAWKAAGGPVTQAKPRAPAKTGAGAPVPGTNVGAHEPNAGSGITRGAKAGPDISGGG
jgi:rhodanese-related sulfurtransferase